MDRENDCFCELVPLYALDVLSAAERDWVEQQIAAEPELAEELVAYQATVQDLAYGAPVSPATPLPLLKERLFNRLSQEVPADHAFDDPAARPTSAVSAAPATHQAIRAQELHWQPHAVPGIRIAIVHTDEIKREVVGFLQAEPGACYPLHRHAAVEEIFMLEGDLVIGEEVYGAGDYIRSYPGSSHAPCTFGGCRFFFRSSLDDEFLPK
ncbi:MAG: cupin domain-containing protein [Synechococcales cyanobacterium M58_A2018_015]|nr:cupin domain-containing protein [Synechococcales cyanobacterium M58_A2018_015]